jgi:hypothetical protein
MPPTLADCRSMSELHWKKRHALVTKIERVARSLTWFARRG